MSGTKVDQRGHNISRIDLLLNVGISSINP